METEMVKKGLFTISLLIGVGYCQFDIAGCYYKIDNDSTSVFAQIDNRDSVLLISFVYKDSISEPQILERQSINEIEKEFTTKDIGYIKKSYSCGKFRFVVVDTNYTYRPKVGNKPQKARSGYMAMSIGYGIWPFELYKSNNEKCY